nr:ribonuclease H-like domain-containing protein [Tanacetum cinerariifolium]
MDYTGDGGHVVFTSHAWRRMFKLRSLLIRELMLEFFSTYKFTDIELGLDVAATKADLRDYWTEISYTSDFLTRVPSYTAIRDPLRRLCHRLIAFNIPGKGQAPEKEEVGFHDVWRSFIRRLAKHFGFLTKDRLRGLTVVIPNHTKINRDELVRLLICEWIGDVFTWVAPGLGRQQVATAGAPERIARLEEEVYGLRESLGEQLAVLDTMSQDFSRFTTWMDGHLSQLLDVCGVTLSEGSKRRAMATLRREVWPSRYETGQGVGSRRDRAYSAVLFLHHEQNNKHELYAYGSCAYPDTEDFNAFNITNFQDATWNIDRCDSSGDLYPVTQLSSLPSALMSLSSSTWHQRLGHTDHGGEFDNTQLLDLFSTHGIQMRFSCPKPHNKMENQNRLCICTSLQVLWILDILIMYVAFKGLYMGWNKPPVLGFIDLLIMLPELDYVPVDVIPLYLFTDIDTAYLLIYVDDIVLTALFQKIIFSLHKEFDMTDLGALNYFLGISVTCDTTWMFLSQKRYAMELLERAHMLNYNHIWTSVDTESKLGPEGTPILDPTLYRSLVATRRSTSGAEAEYRGVANVVAETAWLRNLLLELHTPLVTATLVYCDNHAYIFTKSRPLELFEEFLTSLSVRLPPAQTAREC